VLRCLYAWGRFFEEDRHSWRERQAIAERRRRAFGGATPAFLRGFAWPARVVIALGEIRIAYLALVFGFLIGVGFRAVI
jgi:hypothetical protein